MRPLSRKRSLRVAAAGLSLAMAAAFAPGVFPTIEPEVAHAERATAAETGSDKAIYSPGKASQKGTISGSVKEIVEAQVGFGNVQASGKPLKGVKVYAQWYEGENTQHSSPVYYTESDENGNFTIKMAPYTDAKGVNREFRADASVGTPDGGDWSWDENREKIRVWTELPEDMTDKYRLVHQPAAGIFPGIGANTTPTTQGDAQWGDNKITGMTIQYAQKDKLPQHLPENKWAESTGTGGNGGTYAGRAFWNLDVLQGALNHNTVSAFGGKDIPAAGMKVVGSYLTDDAVNKIEAYAKTNFAGKTLRGKGWTVEDEQGLQRWINEQVAADPEAWIAETLTTTTGADGKFELRWKGIYGNSHNSRGIVPADKAGKLAGSHGEGAWTNGALDSKHVNMHWSYVSILDKDGNPLPDNIGALYPWSLGQWAGPGFGADLNAGANAQLFGGDGAYIGNTTDGYTGWNIALAPQALKFDVVDKNTTDNWAALGDKVQTYTAGLPISDDLNYYIEWVDKNGKVVKTCETHKADSATMIPSCELEVPVDAQTGDTFTARLKVADGDPDPKNDLILAMDAFAVSRDYLKYDPVDAKADEKATSQPKFDNPETGPEETKPEKAKFELGKLPEGVTEDQVTVDPATGVVTFTPNADQAGKTFDFPVVMRDEALQVPVLDENGDPVKDESGKPKTQGRVVARAEAVFNVVKDDDGDGVTPDPDGDNDGKPDDPNAPEADSQGVTFSVKIDGTIVESDGNNDTAEELPESVRDVVVTLTAEDGTEFKSNDNGETWRGAKKYPLVQNFGSKDLPKGKYTVSVSGLDDINKDDLKLKKDSQLRDGATVEITGNTGNLFVELETVDSKNYEPSYEEKLVVPGEETKSSPTFTDKDGKDAKAPEGSKFTIGEDFTAPEGYEVKIDESTGEITVTFPDKSKLNKDTKEEFDVPVTVTYPDGSTDEAPAKFKLDTDNDGKPDTEDGDDDGDGIPDEDDSNPKVPNANDHYEPGYEDGSGKPGDEVKIEKPEFKDKDGNPTEAPEGTTFGPGENTPDGVTIDENTGEITVTIPEDAKPGDKIEVPVVVTYPDGTTDEVTVTVTVEEPDAPEEPGDKDADTYEPAYEDKLVVPGKETKSTPTFTDKDGKDAKAPEGSKFTIGEDFTAPEGYEVKIDESTGEITVTFPDKSKLNKDTKEEFDVPVTVTYPDGSTDEAPAKFKLDTDNDGKPDTEDGDDDGDGIPDGEDDNPKVPNQNTVYEPEYEDGSGKPGDNVTIDEPGFKDKDGKDTKAPEGTKFTPGDDAPEGVKVDENTGEITVPIPEDATPGDKIEVPVVVTYPDGTTDEVTVTVTVEKPDTPEQPDTKQADELEPEYKEGFGQPGTKAPVDEPTFTDKDGNKVTVPEGTKFTTDKDGVEIAEDGSLKVQIPADAKPGDKITVPVTVTYPDGSTDTVDVIVNVTDPDSKPEWGDGEGEPGDEVTVPNEGGDVPEGSTPEVDGPGKAEIDEDGNLIVDIDEDAKPGDEIVIVVKDPEGNTIDESTVTVTEPSTPAEKDADKYTPEYEDGSGKPGDNVTIDEPGFKDKDGKDTKAPEGTKFTPGDDAPEGVKVDENTGEITVPIPEDAKPGDKITVPVDVTYPDGSKDTAEVTVTVEKPDAPAEKPDWKDDSGKPGDTVEIPNTGGKVEDGTTVETEGPGKAEIDEDGKITVDIDDDAKPGDKVVVIVKDKDGNEIDRVVVEVEKPDAPAEKPDWKDDSGKPGDTVEIPNTGGKVEDGTTVETEGPGKAEIDKDGNIRVEIDKNAKPGDKIKVVVKDKDGKVIDEITVTVKDPKKTDAENYQPKWNDSTIKPGDTITLPNIGDKLPDGTTLEIKGKDLPNGWGVQIDKTGAIKVTAPSWAKPGDKVKIPVHITYPDGSTEVVYFTVTVTGDTDNGGSNDKGAPLPRTGVEVGAALAAATALIAGGIALIARSRRRNN